MATAQPDSFHGEGCHTDGVELSVQPLQRPHPPLWMVTRDPPTLEFCAKNGLHPGYFLFYPRAEAARRYRKFLADWKAPGRPGTPNIAYSTVVFVDESDEKALDTALFRASRAYEGFLARPKPGEASRTASPCLPKCSSAAASPALRKSWPTCSILIICSNTTSSSSARPKRSQQKSAPPHEAGVFNVLMGEFNFSDLPEGELMRSIRLFGEKVIPGAARVRTVLVHRHSGAERKRGARNDEGYCAFASSGCARSRAVLSRWIAKHTIAPATNGSADHM